MALGAHGNSFLKKALKEMKQTKKRNCRICKKGAEGANSEAWNVQFGPRSPAPVSAPLAFQAGRKNTDKEKALAAWEGEMRQQQGKVSPARRWRGGLSLGVRKMDVPVPLQPPRPQPPRGSPYPPAW